jgi:OFA family oxalate/formate antiporter-like MFS transporter
MSLGIGTGLVYSAVLFQAWLYFPGREGIISGIIIAGFGIGGFFFTWLSTELVNPEQLDPV